MNAYVCVVASYAHGSPGLPTATIRLIVEVLFPYSVISKLVFAILKIQNNPHIHKFLADYFQFIFHVLGCELNKKRLEIVRNDINLLQIEKTITFTPNRSNQASSQCSNRHILGYFRLSAYFFPYFNFLKPNININPMSLSKIRWTCIVLTVNSD